MPTGPQRKSGFNNIVETDHGQVLGRQSDTKYTHAVVHTVPIEQHRARLSDQHDFYQGLIAKYGEDVDPRYHKEAKKLSKELGSLPESTHYSSLVSMHTGASQAQARAKRESNKGTFVRVLPVRND